MTVVLNNFKK